MSDQASVMRALEPGAADGAQQDVDPGGATSSCRRIGQARARAGVEVATSAGARPPSSADASHSEALASEPATEASNSGEMTT